MIVSSRFLETRDWADVQATTIAGDSASKVVTFREGESPASELVGFTVTRGNQRNGGGMYFIRSGGRISDSIIENNTTPNSFGGVAGVALI